jgi:6-phosphogluconolactonase
VNASYLAVSADRKNVYAVSESGGGNGGVNAYSFNPLTGELKFLNTVPSEGDHPCYVSVDNKKKFVFVGNYTGGNLVSIPLNADGSFRTTREAVSSRKDRRNRMSMPLYYLRMTAICLCLTWERIRYFNIVST